jgi:hypothetical protein
VKGSRELSPPPKTLKETGRRHTLREDRTKDTPKPGILRSMTLKETGSRTSFFGGFFGKNDPPSPSQSRRPRERDLERSPIEEEVQPKRKAERRTERPHGDVSGNNSKTSKEPSRPPPQETSASKAPEAQAEAKKEEPREESSKLDVKTPPASERPGSLRGENDRSHRREPRSRTSRTDSDKPSRSRRETERETERRPRARDGDKKPAGGGLSEFMRALVG